MKSTEKPPTVIQCEGLSTFFSALAFVVVLFGIIFGFRACQMTDDMTAERAVCLWRNDCPKTEGVRPTETGGDAP